VTDKTSPRKFGAEHPWIIVGLASLFVVLQSSAFVAAKMAVVQCPPLMLLMARTLAGAIVMLVIARAVSIPWPPTRRERLMLALRGIINGSSQMSTLWALKYNPAGLVVMASAAIPLLVLLVGAKMLGEKLATMRIIGVVCSFSGVLMVLLARFKGGHAVSAYGSLFLVVNVVVGFLNIMFFKKYPPREHQLIFQGAQLLTAGIILVPLTFVFERPTEVVITKSLALAFLYHVAFITLGAQILWRWLLLRDIGTAASFQFFIPVVGLALAALVLHDPFTGRDTFGLVAITIGAILIRRSPKGTKVKPKMAPAPEPETTDASTETDQPARRAS
jgi:drug/metabolite transporter (DMT)-like permease